MKTKVHTVIVHAAKVVKFCLRLFFSEIRIRNIETSLLISQIINQNIENIATINFCKNSIKNLSNWAI